MMGWIGSVALLVACGQADDQAGARGPEGPDPRDELAPMATVDDPDVDGDGAPASADCDDTDPTRFPGAYEACNGIDDDCNPATADEDGIVDASGASYADMARAIAASHGSQVRVCGEVPPFEIDGPVEVVSLHEAAVDLSWDAPWREPGVGQLERILVRHEDARLVGFTVHDGATGAVRIEGGTVVGLRVEGSTNPDDGGAVHCTGGTVRDLVVLDARSEARGGGLYAEDCVVDQAIIDGTSARSGGGAYLVDSVASQLTVTDASAAEHGGGVYAENSDLSGIVVTDNRAGLHGGGAFVSRGEILDSTAVANTALEGGGMWLVRTKGADLEVRDNRAQTAGGLHADRTSLETVALYANEAQSIGGLRFDSYLTLKPTWATIDGLVLHDNVAPDVRGAHLAGWVQATGIDHLDTGAGFTMADGAAVKVTSRRVEMADSSFVGGATGLLVTEYGELALSTSVVQDFLLGIALNDSPPPDNEGPGPGNPNLGSAGTVSFDGVAFDNVVDVAIDGRSVGEIGKAGTCSVALGGCK